MLPGNDGYYTVVRGDSLSLIARNHGMTTDDLMRLNGISNANMIWVGQKLRVSARVPAVPLAVEQAGGRAPAGQRRRRTSTSCGRATR